MKLSKINPILAIALMSVLATSMLSTQFSSLNSLIHAGHENASNHDVEAASLPLPVDFHYKIKEKAGDAAAGDKYVEIDENFIDSENSCEFCTYVKVKPGPKGQTGFVYTSDKGLDLSNAKSITFFVMGLDGGEKLKFNIAGKTVTDKVGKTVTDKTNNGNAIAPNLFEDKKFALATEEVTLENDWLPFSIDLTDVPKEQLTGVTYPFAIEMSKIKGEQEFYIKHIMYKAEEAELNTLATTETANATLVANATTANATDASTDDNLTDTTIENATDDAADNVTDTVPSNLTDAEDEESESDEEPAANDVPANDTGGDGEAVVDSNDTATTSETEEDAEDEAAGENATQPSSTEEENTPPIAMANDDITAYPGDQVLLDGLASFDEDGDALTYEWSQSAGPALEIANEDAATPLVSIPSDIDEDAEAEIDLVVSDGNAESEADSVTISIDYVEPPADDQQIQTQELAPDSVQESEWETECSDLAECLADGDENTFASTGSGGDEDLEKADLLSFGDLEVGENEEAQIEQVIIQVDAAKNGETGYIKFHADDAESFTSNLVSITSTEEAAEYRLILENDPGTGDEWTVDSVNSIVAGYGYGGGSSEVRVAAMKLTVIYTTTIIASEETAEEESDDDLTATDEEEESNSQPTASDQEDEGEDSSSPVDEEDHTSEQTEADDDQQEDEDQQQEEEESPEDSEQETNNDTGGDEEQVDSEEEQQE